jgi:FkbM family methyltransferase
MLSGTVKTISMRGIPTHFEGAADDPYFLALEENAQGLEALGAVVSRHVPCDATVIDVGANIGLSAITLARRAKKVMALEPSPPNVSFLRRNLQLNGIANVDLVVAAASSEIGTLRFHVAQFGAGSHVVSAGDLSRGAPAIDVPAIPLDRIDLPRIDFIKIDVEGHEPEVLAGARRLLARDRPLILMEINIWCLTAYADHNPAALIRKLWERFEVWAPTDSGDLIPLEHSLTFLHRTILQAGGAADVVLRPRAGVDMPTLPELSWPETALAALRRSLPEVDVSKLSAK